MVLLAGAGPAVGLGEAPVNQAETPDTVQRTGDALAQYKVSLDNVTIRTWLLRNATVRNATVEEVVVRNATTADGAREDVRLTNVTVGEFAFERGRLQNVTARRLVVRNKSVLNVPGGEFIDPNVDNRTIERQWTRNATVFGVTIDRIAVDAAVLCGNTSLGERADDPAAFDPRGGETAPDIDVQNGTVEEALVIRGQAANWSVESVDQPEATNASLPQECNRG